MNKKKLFLVDDDAIYLKSLEIEFLATGEFEVETFLTGEDCVANLSHNPDVIILDYLLDGLQANATNGLETLILIKKYNHNFPVIILSAQDKIEVAVNCMKHNAFDYIVKSETAILRLRKVIDAVFYLQKIKEELSWYMSRM